MKIYTPILLAFFCFTFCNNINSFSQEIIDTESAILFSNHTDLYFTSEIRISGDIGMVDTGKFDIRPWEGSNYHDLGNRVVTTILDVIFNIDVGHKKKGHLAKFNRFALFGNKDYSFEIDIKYNNELVFTIDYKFIDHLLSFQNPTKYNVKYADGTYDAMQPYSLLHEQGNHPHAANRELMINNRSYKLIYGSFDNSLDATNNLIFSLSETVPTTLNFEPEIDDIENPTVLNVLTYNIGLLMPLGANDQEERERVPVLHLATPKNMDIIMWQEMFEQFFVNQIIDSLVEFYPYYTSPHNRPDIPGITKNGGALIMSKHPILEEDDFSYTRDGGVDGEDDSALADKGVKYAKINKGGQIVHVFNTHTGGNELENDVMGKWIYEKLEQNYDDIVIMGGDMNTSLFDTAYYRMIDSLEVITPTYNTLLEEQPEIRGTTWGYNHYNKGRGDTANLIDYVFASLNFKVPTVCYNETQAYRLNVVDRNFWGVFDLGDHQPVYCRMEFPTIIGVGNNTDVCPGGSFDLEVETSLEDYEIKWFKDDLLLTNENTLSLTRNNIEENDWGNYRCELNYHYEADEAINSTPSDSNQYLPYIHPGKEAAKLVREFVVGPDTSICQATTTSVFSLENYDISIYPNPVINQLIINFEGSYDIKIIDEKGQEMFARSINGLSEIDSKHWSKGIYFIEFYDEGNLIGAQKIVKQ